MGEFRKVCAATDIPDGEGKCFEVGGAKVAVFNLGGGEFCALDDVCNHMGASLSDGALEGDRVMCPWHGATFSVRDGTAAGPPARGAATTFNVRLDGDDVLIES